MSMNEFLAKRIQRKLDALPEERAYQVLDYIEFLESRYAERQATSPSAFQRLAETVEDTLRAGRVGVNVMRGTMDAMSAASRVMGGIAAAGKAVVDQVSAELPKQPPRLQAPPPPEPPQLPQPHQPPEPPVVGGS